MHNFEEHLSEIIRFSMQKPPEEMLKECLNILIKISGATGGSILGEEGQGLKFLFSDVAQLIGVYVPWESIAGAAASGNVGIYTFAPSDKRHFDGLDSEIAKQTRYLLSLPIPSVHNSRTDQEGEGRAVGTLQLLFDENVFPEMDVESGAVEFPLDTIRDHQFYVETLREVLMVLPNISLGMEVMKLRETSYQAIHELKNKLISAQSWVNCLREDIGDLNPEILDNEDVQEDIELATDAVDSGAKLALGYLQFTKIYVPSFQDGQINDVIESAASDIQAFVDDSAGEGAITVTSSIGSDIPLRKIDPAQLKMAFFNLGKNAGEALMEHGVENPKISLSSEFSTGQIVVTISDNGNGMPEEIASNLFVAFKTKKVGGTGLGLTITKKIIDVHGGRIRCDTGQDGTAFTLQFPE